MREAGLGEADGVDDLLEPLCAIGVGRYFEEVAIAGVLDKVPGLHDRFEPGVEFFVGRYFIEIAVFDEPYLASVIHLRSVAEKRDSLRAVDHYSSRIISNS